MRWIQSGWRSMWQAIRRLVQVMTSPQMFVQQNGEAERESFPAPAQMATREASSSNSMLQSWKMDQPELPAYWPFHRADSTDIFRAFILLSPSSPVINSKPPLAVNSDPLAI